MIELGDESDRVDDPIIERIRAEEDENGTPFDPDAFASRYATLAAEMDAKSEAEYFSGSSHDDAMTSESEFEP
eukprot:10692740-Karenia_brevis.AAC.1